jgi:hypothetical protein
MRAQSKEAVGCGGHTISRENVLCEAEEKNAWDNRREYRFGAFDGEAVKHGEHYIVLIREERGRHRPEIMSDGVNVCLSKKCAVQSGVSAARKLRKPVGDFGHLSL